MKKEDLIKHLEHIQDLLQMDGCNSKKMALNDIQFLLKELSNETSNGSNKRN